MKTFDHSVTRGVIGCRTKLVNIQETAYLPHQVAINLFSAIGYTSYRAAKPTHHLFYYNTRYCSSLLVSKVKVSKMSICIVHYAKTPLMRLGMGKASAHLLNGSMHVRMYTEPLRVLGCGPVMSICSFSNGAPARSGCKGPLRGS